MSWLPIDIPPGVISDDTAFSADGRWADASGVRFWRGKPQVHGGFTAAFDGIDGICRTIMPWTNNAGSPLVALGTHTKLQVYASGELYDITPGGLQPGSEHSIPGLGYGAGSYGEQEYGNARNNSAARTWALDAYGESLMANPRGRPIYWWQNDVNTPAIEIVAGPAICTYMLVTPERQVLAFGCNEVSSGDFNPLCIRGCDIENPNEWEPKSDNNAFEHILPGGGRIVAARMIGSDVAVWTENAVYRGRFVGNFAQTYRFDRIAADHGLIGPNAVAVIDQTAYWIGPDFQFRFWPSGAPPQIMACPIRNDFKNNLAEAQGDKICAAPLTQFGEIWWHYPDARDGMENSRYIAVSTLDGSWFPGILARTAICDAGISGYPMKVTADGRAFYHENGRTANGGVLEWFLRSSDQYLEESGRQMLIRGIRPDFEDQAGAVSLTVYARKYPQSASMTKGPFTLGEGASKKDFLLTGGVLAFQFSGSASPSFMRLGKPVIDAVPTGEQ